MIPLFIEQIENGGPVTITTPEMTRFLLSLERAVDTIFGAFADGHAGETFIPRVPAALMTDVAKALIGDRSIEMVFTGIRPGEKTHEILVSEEEAHRTVARGGYYVILPILPELRPDSDEPVLGTEYSSADELMSLADCAELLETFGLSAERLLRRDGDLLR